MEEPIFDIIIPIYNVDEKLLINCFDSIKNQSYKNYSVFVCDGKPTNENRELVNTYGFKYVEQDFSNYPKVGGARNQAISIGNHPYIAFLDGDDAWYKHYLREMVSYINSPKHNPTIMWSAVMDCKYILQSLKTDEVYTMDGVYAHYESTPFLDKYPHYAYYHFFGHPPVPSNTIVRRDAFLEFNQDLSIIEDTECWMRMFITSTNDESLYFEPVPLIGGYHYIGKEQTTNRGNQTSISQNKTIDEVNEVFKQNWFLFNELHPMPLMEDKPNDVSTKDWKQLLTTVGGVNRTQEFNL